jgi:homoserine dehydrogenase
MSKTTKISFKQSITPRNVGVVGFGNIGAGLVDLLYGDKITNVHLVKIAVRDLSKKRPISVPSQFLTDNFYQLINDRNIDTIVELIGGIEPAEKLIVEALRNGKDVITANKALIASKGDEIFSMARSFGRNVGFRGTFVGCHALFHELDNAATRKRIRRVQAVLSGTCNYILTTMARDNKSFEDALKEAQHRGYAESDPSNDIDGTDTADKTRILLGLVSNAFETRKFHVEGIANITSDDIRFAQELGYSVKLLGVIEHTEGVFYVAVHPALVSPRSLLGTLDRESNGIQLKDEHGIVSGFCAPGAGRYPTAMAVAKDLIDLANGNQLLMPTHSEGIRFGSLNDLTRRYYIRLSLVDRIGSLAKIANVFSNFKISIAAVSQKETIGTELVPVVLTTHLAKERDVLAAISEIETLDIVVAKTNLIRIIET